MAKMIMCLLQAKGTKGQFQVALNLYRAPRYFGTPSNAIKTKRNQLYQLHGNTSHFDDFGPILGLKLGGLGQKVKNKSCSMGLPGLSSDGICLL